MTTKTTDPALIELLERMEGLRGRLTRLQGKAAALDHQASIHREKPPRGHFTELAAWMIRGLAVSIPAAIALDWRLLAPAAICGLGLTCLHHLNLLRD